MSVICAVHLQGVLEASTNIDLQGVLVAKLVLCRTTPAKPQCETGGHSSIPLGIPDAVLALCLSLRADLQHWMDTHEVDTISGLPTSYVLDGCERVLGIWPL